MGKGGEGGRETKRGWREEVRLKETSHRRQTDNNEVRDRDRDRLVDKETDIIRKKSVAIS